MSDAPTDRWPRFKMVTFSQPTGIPHRWDRELIEKGAPDGLVFGAAHELTLLEDPGSGPLVCCGIGGAGVNVCLDPRTGQVVEILCYPPAHVIRSALLVNSSL